MKHAARLALAIVILLAGFLFLPRPAARVVAPDAFGQEVPTEVPTIIRTGTPTPSPTRTKSPKPPPPPEEDPGKDPRDDNNKDRGGSPIGDRKTKRTGGGKGSGKGIDAGKGKGADKKKDKKDKKKADASAYTGPFNATGEFDTDRLELVAAKLKGRGFSERRIIRSVYAPFILAGPAAWTNTWGAPRYGPGPITRTHEGQDVFCRYGDPVLATEPGTIEFDDGGLGGIVARLYRKDGSYWYYAHLSDVNDRDFKNGDAVKTGDVIGYCGNTGNAITTPPHVHFGWYQANGESKDPMGYLVKWLRQAERNAALAYKRATGRSIATIEQEISSRRFGDSFAPDISELKVSSEALLAAGASPGSSAFGLAEAALQAALAEREPVPPVVDAQVEGASGDEHSELVEELESISESPPSSNSGD